MKNIKNSVNLFKKFISRLSAKYIQSPQKEKTRNDLFLSTFKKNIKEKKYLKILDRNKLKKASEKLYLGDRLLTKYKEYIIAPLSRIKKTPEFHRIVSKILRKKYYIPSEINTEQGKKDVKLNTLIKKERQLKKKIDEKYIKDSLKKKSRLYEMYYKIILKINNFKKFKYKIDVERNFYNIYNKFKTNYLTDYFSLILRNSRLRVTLPYWKIFNFTLKDTQYKYENESLKYQLNLLSFFYKHSRKENFIKFSNDNKKKKANKNFLIKKNNELINKIKKNLPKVLLLKEEKNPIKNNKINKERKFDLRNYFFIEKEFFKNNTNKKLNFIKLNKYFLYKDEIRTNKQINNRINNYNSINIIFEKKKFQTYLTFFNKNSLNKPIFNRIILLNKPLNRIFLNELLYSYENFQKMFKSSFVKEKIFQNKFFTKYYRNISNDIYYNTLINIKTIKSGNVFPRKDLLKDFHYYFNIKNNNFLIYTSMKKRNWLYLYKFISLRRVVYHQNLNFSIKFFNNEMQYYTKQEFFLKKIKEINFTKKIKNFSNNLVYKNFKVNIYDFAKNFSLKDIRQLFDLVLVRKIYNLNTISQGINYQKITSIDPYYRHRIFTFISNLLILPTNNNYYKNEINKIIFKNIKINISYKNKINVNL